MERPGSHTCFAALPSSSFVIRVYDEILGAKFEKLAQSLKDKESEVTRLALENEEHLKRVSELTAYIQQASQDREQIIQQYTSYRLVIDILEMNFRP